jgi:DNA-binding transcriptional LysR family regulator
VVEAAAAGLGIARVMSHQAANAISDRRFTTILRGFAPDPMPASLMHQPQRIQPLKLRAFLDFVLPRLTLALARVDEASNWPTASDNSPIRRL